jgi:DNA-binding NarL/FixJ family response regulator
LWHNADRIWQSHPKKQAETQILPRFLALQPYLDNFKMLGGFGTTMKILIADDHAVFRDGLKYILRELDSDVQFLEASDANSIKVLVHEHKDFDLILTDLRMPGMNPSGVITGLAVLAPDTPIIVLSASDRLTDMRQCLDAGARGYILKSETATVMLAAIRLVISGSTYIPPKMVNAARIEGKDPDSLQIKITNRQIEVLRLLVDGQSNKQIANALELTEATVKAHVSATFKALNVSNRTQAALVARQMGLDNSY